MHFALTRFLYPVKGVLPLSSELGLTLANPQTAEELSVVREAMEELYGHRDALAPPPQSDEDVVSLESIFERLEDVLRRTDPDALDALPTFDRANPVDAVARITVLIRWDLGETARLFAQDVEARRARGERVVAFWDDDGPERLYEQDIESYYHLLGLLVIPDAPASGASFVIGHAGDLRSVRPPSRVWLSALLLAHFVYTWPNSHPEGRWQYFPVVRDAFQENAALIDQALKSPRREKVLYVGHLLQRAQDAFNDPRSQLLTLTSILELLLTHNPNSNRFNVEDSITRQFVLKTALLAYVEDRNVSLADAKRELRDIYAQRSNIVHGNFETLSKWIEAEKTKKAKETGEGADETHYPLEQLVFGLYGYVRTAVRAYLQEPAFVEFLKDG